MPLEVIRTIKSAGGDFTSLSSWESSRQGDLTTAGTTTSTTGRIETAECYNFDLSNGFTINGWTTTASNYIKIYTKATDRHDGRPRDTSASGFRIHNNGNTITFNVSYHIRFEGLEVLCTATGSSTAPFIGLSTTTGTNGDVRVTDCIVSNWNIAAAAIRANNTAARLTVTNTMVFSACDGIIFSTNGASNGVVKHCTCLFIGSTATTTSRGVLAANQVWNTYCGKFTTDFSFGTVTATGKNNASADTTATTNFGTGSLTSMLATQQFVFVHTATTGIGATALDTHLVATSGLIGAGSTATGVSDVTTDIDGDTR